MCVCVWCVIVCVCVRVVCYSVCVCVCVCACVSPVVVGEAGSPIGRPEQGLQSTGQVHEQVTHQEEPADDRGT